MDFHKNILKVDLETEVERICSFIKEQTIALKRDGMVIGLSGGIDSALSAALCVRALGSDKVFGLLLPEKDSDPNSTIYGRRHAEVLGIDIETIDITPTLESLGTYEKRDEVIKNIFPEYDNSYKSKITLPSDLLSKDTYNVFKLTIEDQAGNKKSARLGIDGLNGIVAATNTKQRTRMLYLYYYAELKNYLVCGTTNRSEVIQGFFVKYGDGGVDLEPLAHLFKVQVYQLAKYLNVIEEIINRPPSPDTYSMHVSDEEFYFRIPYDKLDLLLYAWENEIPIPVISKVMNLKEEQVKRAFRDFSAKYYATKNARQYPPYLSPMISK